MIRVCLLVLEDLQFNVFCLYGILTAGNMMGRRFVYEGISVQQWWLC